MIKRPGFSLLELAMAAFLMSVIVGGVMTAFMGMQRTQGTAASQALLKAAGQKAIANMYLELSQCRKILASASTDPPVADMGREYFLRFTRQATPATIPLANMRFPRVDANGGLGFAGDQSGELERTTVGNALAFIAAGSTLDLATPLVAYQYGWPLTIKMLPAQPYQVSTVRFISYHLVETTLPTGVAPIKLTSTQSVNHTQQLVRWESKPYLEKGEFQGLVDKFLPGLGPLSTLAVWNWLQNHTDPEYRVAGLWDADEKVTANAFYTVNGAGALERITNPSVARKRQTKAAETNIDPYAIGMVAFNTRSDYRFDAFAVPSFAVETGLGTIPYGFEVAIVGPTGARSVLLRLALAARVNTSRHLYGIAQQQVIKVVDM